VTERRNDEFLFNWNVGLSRLLVLSLNLQSSTWSRILDARPCAQSKEKPMLSRLVVPAIVVSAVVLGSAAGNAAGPMAGAPTTTVPGGAPIAGGAPIGHLQPRAQQFSPSAPAEQTEQQQISAYDARQQKLDEELDKRLNICRGC
jgi:hypothetical protein